MKRLLLRCRFRFEAYAKVLGQKATQCSLKTTEVLLDDDGHGLIDIYQGTFKFDIYQGTVAPNCLQNHTNF